MWTQFFKWWPAIMKLFVNSVRNRSIFWQIYNSVVKNCSRLITIIHAYQVVEKRLFILFCNFECCTALKVLFEFIKDFSLFMLESLSYLLSQLLVICYTCYCFLQRLITTHMHVGKLNGLEQLKLDSFYIFDNHFQPTSDHHERIYFYRSTTVVTTFENFLLFSHRVHYSLLLQYSAVQGELKKCSLTVLTVSYQAIKMFHPVMIAVIDDTNHSKVPKFHFKFTVKE